jgi:DNA invertase Pin-like site-specific DNA recombinase
MANCAITVPALMANSPVREVATRHSWPPPNTSTSKPFPKYMSDDSYPPDLHTEPQGGHEMATAFGYTRVSTQDQKDSGLGLEAQKQDIERYYQYLLAPKDVAWGGLFVDPAVSGNTLFVERDAGGRLNGELRQGDHVIMAKLDRGFRRTDDCCNTVNQWKDRGITLHIRDLSLDTSTPTGDMVIKILSIVAEWERRRIGERSAAAVKIARQNGKAANGFAGYGFKYVGAKGNRRRVPDDEERAVMKGIVGWRLQGMAFDKIYFCLLGQGIKTKEGREWSLSRIYRAFQAELLLMAKETTRLPANSDASPAPRMTGE